MQMQMVMKADTTASDRLNLEALLRRYAET